MNQIIQMNNLNNLNQLNDDKRLKDYDIIIYKINKLSNYKLN